MSRRIVYSMIVAVGLFWPLAGQAESIDVTLSALGAIGESGLATSGQGTGSMDSDFPGSAGEGLDDRKTRFRERAGAFVPLGRLDGRIRTFSGGIPGIDGLNTAPAAFRNALGGLDPVLIQSVLEGVEPAVLSQITHSLTAALPGLENPEDLNNRLPGIDGLPIGGRP